MAAKMESHVELGFLEEESPDSLTASPSNQTSSNFFPSKVGGRPVWLDPVHLPSPEQLECKTCRKPCLLLLQMYAPLSDHPQTYHRSLFVFMCTNRDCHRKKSSLLPFRVLRCTLPRGNPYYPSEEGAESTRRHSPIDEEGSYLLANPSPLCGLCGCPAPNRCGQCRKVHYCSRYHQLLDWKMNHKTDCKDFKNGKEVDEVAKVSVASGILLTEYEIVTEAEPNYQLPSEKERMAAYENYISSERYSKSKLSDEDAKDTEDLKMAITEDKTFSKFKQRVSIEPDQVIRFQPGGDPLLISGDPAQSPSMIPQCDKCQSPRQFECQIMPQLLYYLKLDSTPSQPSIDWGTLLIYTCSANCFSSPGYNEEFLWKQDPPI